jgi:RecA/RadA recombinase
MEIRRVTNIKEGDNVVGIRSRLRVVKNRVAPPFRQTELDIYSGLCRCHPVGVDGRAAIVELAEKAGLITRNGTWYQWREERLGQGRAGIIEFFDKKPERMEELKKQILELGPLLTEPEPADENENA